MKVLITILLVAFCNFNAGATTCPYNKKPAKGYNYKKNKKKSKKMKRRNAYGCNKYSYKR